MLVKTVSRAWPTPAPPRSPLGPFETMYINEIVAACNGGGGARAIRGSFSISARDEVPLLLRLFVNRARFKHPLPEEASTPPRVSEERNA